jgi:vitamin B12 transporter
MWPVALLGVTAMRHRLPAEERTSATAPPPNALTTSMSVVLAALLWHAVAHAGDEASTTLESILVTGTRVPTTLGEGTDSITVVTRKDLDRMAMGTGVDLFRQIPGLQIDQLGGPGGLSSVYIRGSDPNHVLVLIDGVRVNDPTNSRGGGFDFSGLDPSQIERIEVLRGAASSVYGADAMGGVINIVTRGSNAGLSAGASYGGLGYRAARASGSIDNVFRANVSTLRDGREADGVALDLTQIGASVTLPTASFGNVTLDARHGRRKSSSFPDDSGGLQFATLRELERHDASDTRLSARGRWDFDAWTVNVAASSYAHVEDIVSPGVAPGERNPIGVPASTSRTDFLRRNLLASAVFHLPGGSEIAAGAEYQHERGDSQVLYTLFGTPVPVSFDLRRATRAAFVELKWLATTDVVVRAGWRRDAVGGDAASASPSVGVRYDLPVIDASLKASYSEGFKPPSFFALGLPAAFGGNPDLRAEHSKGGSIGYEQKFWGGKGVASVALFKTLYKDLVTYDNEANRIVNAGHVDIRGAEFALSVPIGSSVRSTFTFTRLLSHVADSDEPLRQRPGRRGAFDLTWSVDERSSLNWRAEYIANVFDSSVPMGSVTLPTAIRHDVAYVATLISQVRVSLALDNVLDRQNQSYVGQPAPGRRARVALDATF